MPDFSYNSKFNKEANFVSIRFGADAPLLETELNEMQDIQRHRLKSALKAIVQDGLLAGGSLTYDGSKFIIENTDAIIDGEVYHISHLEITVSNGEDVYLKVWEKDISYQSTIKKYGNEQEVTIPNEIFDERVNQETSRRVALVYDLTKVIDDNGKFLKLGRISGGSFIKEVQEIAKLTELADISQLGSLDDLKTANKVNIVEAINELSETKVNKVSGKGLSTEDYTTVEKNKLAGIEDGANKTIINDTLTSTSTTQALSARQGKTLKDDLDAHKADNVAHGTATQAEAQAGTSNDKYMTPLRTKEAIQALQSVSSVNSKTGAVTLSKADVGLGNVDNVKQLPYTYGNIVTVSSSITLGTTHADTVLNCTNSSDIVITVPTTLDVKTQITVIRSGTGKVTFAPASGVTLNSKDNKRSIDGRYASATLIKTATNTWTLIGALE